MDYHVEKTGATVKSADGTPGRVFDLDDEVVEVVVYNILPGTDLTAT